MSKIVWKTEDLKDAGFKGIRQIVGEVNNYQTGTWVGDKFGKGAAREYAQYDLVDCELEKVDDPNFTLKNDEFSFRVNLSGSKGSNWQLFLEGAEKAGIELPEGILNKRVRFVWADNIRGNIKGGTLVPSEVVDGGSASPTLMPEERAMELLGANSSVRAFRRAALLDNKIATDQTLKEKVESGDFIEEKVAAGLVEVDGDTYSLSPEFPKFPAN